MTNRNKYFIIDFDSTFTRVEALDELASISLKDHPSKDNLLKEIHDITHAGMEGKISIAESLSMRLRLLNANKSHLASLIESLKKQITPSFERNTKFFNDYKNYIFILSSGFKEFIVPVVKLLGIEETHVYANTFIYDKEGKIIGLDEKNVLAKSGGKEAQLRKLKLEGEIYVIGDGYTDYELQKTGLITKFFAFTENIERDIVVKNADGVAPTLDEFLFINQLPMSISYPKNRLKVLLLENIHNNAVELFKHEGYIVENISHALEEDELCKKIKDVSILCIRSKTELTKKVLEASTRLMAVGAFCIGTNQIALAECAERGIAVFNAPFSNTRSVVELAVGEMIMLMRNIFDKSVKLHNGEWDKSAKNCFEIRGKKLGIVGYGNIGSQLSVVAESLGMEVHFYDVVEKLALGNATKYESLHELLKKCDIISLHVDGNPNNNNLIAEAEFEAMKDGVILLNLSRGSIVDLQALAKYIKQGKVRGASVDVFPYEPKSNDEAFHSELRKLPNVILTPHIGGSTEEAQKNIGSFVASRLVDFVNAGNTYLSVNLPNIQLPKLHDAHRLIHIHMNTAGVLAQINSILAKNKINILGQYLKTNETTGYVITDVGKKYNDAVIEELKRVQHTIKFRILY